MNQPLKPSSLLENLYRDALSGRMRSSLEAFVSSDSGARSESEESIREEFDKRFGAKEPSKPLESDSLEASLIKIFQNYWRQVLLESVEPEKGESLLYDDLKGLCEISGFSVGPYSNDNYDLVEAHLKDHLRSHGFYSLWGVTNPHRELMIWKKQIERTYSIALPDVGAIDVPVVLLDDFLSFGWAGYATLGRHHTGGWATSNFLYCVLPSYDIDSEEFKVSYLAHEARHFSDYRKYPKLKQTDLEYRAKLTEISLADTTLGSLLEKFRLTAKQDRSSPHAFASFSVVRNLGIDLESSIDSLNSEIAENIRDKAIALIRDHDLELEVAGSLTVTGVL